MQNLPVTHDAFFRALMDEPGVAAAVLREHLPAEVAALRAECGDDFVLMVPGIRPAGSAVGDQKRVMTPRDAVEQGADFLVIGRPITQAPDPAEAARAIVGEL